MTWVGLRIGELPTEGPGAILGYSACARDHGELLDLAGVPFSGGFGTSGGFRVMPPPEDGVGHALTHVRRATANLARTGWLENEPLLREGPLGDVTATAQWFTDNDPEVVSIVLTGPTPPSPTSSPAHRTPSTSSSSTSTAAPRNLAADDGQASTPRQASSSLEQARRRARYRREVPARAAPCTVSRTVPHARRAGLPHIGGPHGLRHSLASALDASGNGLATISALLGHASTAVPSKVYTHMLKGADRTAVDLHAARILPGEVNPDR